MKNGNTNIPTPIANTNTGTGAATSTPGALIFPAAALFSPRNVMNVKNVPATIRNTPTIWSKSSASITKRFP